MTPTQEQLVALGAVFQAAVLADQLARSGQIGDADLACMVGSLLARNPESTLAVYGGDDLNLREGYRALASTLERNPANLQRDPLRYVFALLNLERQLDRRADLQQIIGSRLEQIQQQVGHFGLTHDNVIASCGSLYEDTISTFRQRIQVHGDVRFLQQPGTAAKIRTLLLSGIRSARLWQQLGGRRRHLLLSRRRLLGELYPLLRG
jgi:high frequency lysogenization protein